MAKNPNSWMLSFEPRASDSLVTGKYVSALPKHPSAVNIGSSDATRRSSSSVVSSKLKAQATISAVETLVARVSYKAGTGPPKLMTQERPEQGKVHA
ncbi:hypothetical protein NL676_029934 [Syzygium grande]|nr:hypothetical protein NL676_029934 [Syzygium grande]